MSLPGVVPFLGEGLMPPGLMPAPKLHRIIVWFRRDLRVEDNPALATAMQLAEEVVPVYIYSPEEEGQFQPGRCSRWWLSNSLASLQRDLAALGSRLLLFRAPESRAALCALARDLGAQGVAFNHLYDPISMVRDNEVKAALGAAGLFCRSFNADALREPWEMLDGAGRPLTCFDSFWAAHCGAPAAPPLPLPAPPALPPVHEAFAGQSLEELGIMTPEEEIANSQLEYHWQPGSAGARRLLRDFVDARLRQFDVDRAKTDRASTSRLSPHIHFGEVGVRAVYAAALAKAAEWAAAGGGGGSGGPGGTASVADFLRQLGYREYSRYLSFHFPFTHERALLEHLRAVPWRLDQPLFKAWRQGATGYPIVDAAMREVWSTGWMHNRARVVAASFLVKHLLLPWQWGLKHYWDALLDADLECDALGWQYCAGCLADARPFGELVDLRAEAARFDPDGKYVRRWLPVLARLPAAWIHAPWEAPARALADAGIELGVNYPLPVVSLEESAAALAAAVGVVEGAAAAITAATSSGPFRPPTTHADASAAERVWGGASGGASGAAARRASGPAASAAGAAASLRSFDSALGGSEEVVSNAPAAEEAGGSRLAAGARRRAAPASTLGASHHAHPLPPCQEEEGAEEEEMAQSSDAAGEGPPQEPEPEPERSSDGFGGGGGAAVMAVDLPAAGRQAATAGGPPEVAGSGRTGGSGRASGTVHAAPAAGGGAAPAARMAGSRRAAAAPLASADGAVHRFSSGGASSEDDQVWPPEMKRPRPSLPAANA